MAKAPHPAANLALKKPEDDEDEDLGHHGPKDRDRTETSDEQSDPQVQQEVSSEAEGAAGLSTGGPGSDTDAAPNRPVLTDEDLEPGWSLMDSAPTTGKAVRLVGLLPPGVPAECPAYLHNSRRYTGSATRWQNFAEWRILNSPTPVPFEPLAWSRFE